MTTLLPPGTTDRTEPDDPGTVHGGAPEPERVPPVAAPPPPSVPGDPPGDGEGGGRGGMPPSSPAGKATPGQRKRTRVPSAAAYIPAVALQILAIVALGFIVDVVLVSQLQHDRDQQTLYADFRADLALGIAPVGQLQPPEPPGVPRPGENTSQQAEAEDRLMAFGTPVAVLEIPRLGLTEVVLEGTTSDVMRSGPAHRRDTVLPGQQGTSVIMGRQTTFGGPFSRIDTLERGDQITVVTGQGEHLYEVLGVRREGDPLPPPVEDGSGRLTLVTADGRPLLPSGVLRVDAELVSDPQPAPPKVLTTPLLTEAEQTMATDDGAWYPLVLLGQGLLLAVGATVWARNRIGHWQAWVFGIPVIAALGLTAADQVARLLPNLL